MKFEIADEGDEIGGVTLPATDGADQPPSTPGPGGFKSKASFNPEMEEVGQVGVGGRKEAFDNFATGQTPRGDDNSHTPTALTFNSSSSANYGPCQLSG